MYALKLPYLPATAQIIKPESNFIKIDYTACSLKSGNTTANAAPSAEAMQSLKIPALFLLTSFAQNRSVKSIQKFSTTASSTYTCIVEGIIA